MRNKLYIALGIVVIVFVAVFVQRSNQQLETKQPSAQRVQEVEDTVKLSSGGFLTDSAGKTLYFFAKDTKGTSVCLGECLAKWPVFYTDNPVTNSELKSSDFSMITRSDGGRQSTYKGWPLYSFIMDKSAGDINGEGVGGVWFVAKPNYSVALANDPTLTSYLVDIQGRTLYYFTKDAAGISNCKGECLATWPVFYTESVVVPSLVKDKDFGSIVNSEGSKQTTYKGKPLYYFSMDKNKGDTNGQGVKDVWFVAKL